MDIYIRWGKNDAYGFKLPVNPSSYKINGAQQNTSVNIHASGEINLKGKRALKTVSWSCFFPGKKEKYALTSFHDPITYYVNKLVSVMDKNTTVHLVIGRSINIFGTIESFSWGQDEGNGDINYEISFKEQRDLSGNTISKSIFSADYIVYTWKKGDTWVSAYKKAWGRYLDKGENLKTILVRPESWAVASRRTTKGTIVTKSVHFPALYEMVDETYKVAMRSRKKNKKVINAAIKAYKKAHKKVKKVKEEIALEGCKVVLWRK